MSIITRLLFVGVLTSLLACEKKETRPEVIRPVVTRTVYQQSDAVYRVFPGHSKAEVDMKISSRISGQVVALPPNRLSICPSMLQWSI